MKIGSLDTKIAPLPLPPTPERERDSKGAPVVPGGVSPAAEPSARVELSSAAASRSGGVTTVAGDGSFDSAKVERIAQAVRDGKFTVNPEVIAEKLIINAEELLSRGKAN